MITVTAEMIDTARAVDLVSLVEKYLGEMGRRSGRWMLFHCPFHDDKNPSLGITNGDGVNGPYFECFACGKKGDAITWMVEFGGLDFKQAVQELSGSSGITRADPGQARRRDADPAYKRPPGHDWQARARQVVEGAHNCLLNETGYFHDADWLVKDPESGESVIKRMPAMDYLFERGLTEETIRIWKIGYIPRKWNEKAERWGLSGKDITLFQGILIPTIIDEQIWTLKIRLNIPDRHKYIQVRKEPTSGVPYMIQTLEFNDTVVFTEGEFDALLLWQECEDLTGVMTLGSAGTDLDIANWGLYLVGTKRRLICYDLDEAGEKGSNKLDWLGNSRRIQVPKINPHDKDITDYWRAGGDLRAWLLEELRRG